MIPIHLAGRVVARLARVPELRRGADGVRHPVRRRLLEHQQGTRLRLLTAALCKLFAGEHGHLCAVYGGNLFQSVYTQRCRFMGRERKCVKSRAFLLSTFSLLS